MEKSSCELYLISKYLRCVKSVFLLRISWCLLHTPSFLCTLVLLFTITLVATQIGLWFPWCEAAAHRHSTMLTTSVLIQGSRSTDSPGAVLCCGCPERAGPSKGRWSTDLSVHTAHTWISMTCSVQGAKSPPWSWGHDFCNLLFGSVSSRNH